MLAVVATFPLLTITIYLCAVSSVYCWKQKRVHGRIKLYDKLMLSSGFAVVFQVACLLDKVVSTYDLNNWTFNLVYVFVQAVFGSLNRCTVQFTLWLQMRCIVGRSNQKNYSYIVGNVAAVILIFVSVLSLVSHAVSEGLKQEGLGWTMPCHTFIIMKLIIILCHLVDLSTKMILISLVLYEVIRQKRSNRRNGFGFMDLEALAKRMVLCMMAALFNDFLLLGVALLPPTEDRALRADVMPTTSCINSLINLIILIFSFPTWRERLFPHLCKPEKKMKTVRPPTVSQAPRVSTINQQTEATSECPGKPGVKHELGWI